MFLIPLSFFLSLSSFLPRILSFPIFIIAFSFILSQPVFFFFFNKPHPYVLLFQFPFSYPFRSFLTYYAVPVTMSATFLHIQITWLAFHLAVWQVGHCLSWLEGGWGVRPYPPSFTHWISMSTPLPSPLHSLNFQEYTPTLLSPFTHWISMSTPLLSPFTHWISMSTLLPSPIHSLNFHG